MNIVRLFTIVSFVGIWIGYPRLASAEYFYPYEVQFCTSEDGAGNCDEWVEAWYSEGDIMSTYETCRKTTYPCSVWFVCGPDPDYSISNVHQIALWTYNNHGDVYAHTAAYWDFDTTQLLWRYYPGLDHYNIHNAVLYHAWEWDDLDNYTYWDYTPGRPVMRQEVCYGDTQEECEANIYAIEVWMGNDTDCY